MKDDSSSWKYRAHMLKNRRKKLFDLKAASWCGLMDRFKKEDVVKPYNWQAFPIF